MLIISSPDDCGGSKPRYSQKKSWISQKIKAMSLLAWLSSKETGLSEHQTAQKAQTDLTHSSLRFALHLELKHNLYTSINLGRIDIAHQAWIACN
jgi:hypothetical protein